MLVIYIVEGHFFNSVHKILYFYDKNAVFFQQGFYIFHYAAYIAYMGKNICRGNNVGMAFIFNNLLYCLTAEEVVYCLNSILLSYFCYIGSRLDAYCLHA